MTNNNFSYNNNSPGLIVIEDSVDYSEKFIDFLNNPENFENILNSNKYENFSVYENEKNNLNNNSNNNSMLNKKNNEHSTYKIYKKDRKIAENADLLVYNPTCEALIKKIMVLLFYLEGKIKDIEKDNKLNKNLNQEKLTTLNTQKEELKKLKGDLKNVIKLIRAQKIEKNGQILNENIENKINTLKEKIDFKTKEISKTLDSMSLKIKTNNSYIVGYEKLGKINGTFVKNIRSNISHVWGQFKKLCNYNKKIQKMYGQEILKTIINDKLKPALKQMVNFPENDHKNTKAYINFEYDILTRVFKIFKALKELKYKPNNNNSLKNKFLKPLIDDYLLMLKTKIMKDKKDDGNYENIVANFTSSPYYDFVGDIKSYLLTVKKDSRGKILNRLKELLNAVQIFYNIFSILGYVDNEGIVINKSAIEVMKTLQKEINSAAYNL